MGQARQRKEALKRITVNSDTEFLTEIDLAIKQRVNKNYLLNGLSAELLFEDIGDNTITSDNIRDIIANLFGARLLVEMGSMTAMRNETVGKDTNTLTLSDVIEDMYSFTKEMVDAGDYANWGTAIDELSRMAMTYRCYEPWDSIVKTMLSWTEVKDEDKFNSMVGKVISYLYDGYTVEEE